MTLKRMTFLMTVLRFIADRTLLGSLQFVLRVDKETADGDDLVAFRQPAQDLRVEFPLYPRLDLLWHVMARMLLHVDNLLVSFFDDGIVRDGEECALLNDDFHHVMQAVFPSFCSQS